MGYFGFGSCCRVDIIYDEIAVVALFGLGALLWLCILSLSGFLVDGLFYMWTFMMLVGVLGGWFVVFGMETVCVLFSVSWCVGLRVVG